MQSFEPGDHDAGLFFAYACDGMNVAPRGRSRLFRIIISYSIDKDNNRFFLFDTSSFGGGHPFLAIQCSGLFGAHIFKDCFHFFTPHGIIGYSCRIPLFLCWLRRRRRFRGSSAWREDGPYRLSSGAAAPQKLHCRIYCMNKIPNGGKSGLIFTYVFTEASRGRPIEAASGFEPENNGFAVRKLAILQERAGELRGAQLSV